MNLKYEELPIVFVSENCEHDQIPIAEWDKIVALYEEGDIDVSD